MIMSFGDISTADVINNQVAQLRAIDAGLYDTLGGHTGQVKDNIDSWHANFVYWVELADKVISDPSRYSDWKRVGISLATRAQGLAKDVRDDNLVAAAKRFIVGFPSALSTVVSSTVSAVEEPLTQASLGIVKLLLILGGGLALVSFLLSKSGGGLNLGPVRLGR